MHADYEAKLLRLEGMLLRRFLLELVQQLLMWRMKEGENVSLGPPRGLFYKFCISKFQRQNSGWELIGKLPELR